MKITCLLIFVLFSAVAFSFESMVYKIDFQMDEAARQIRLDGTRAEEFATPKDLTVVYWKNHSSFFEMVSSVNQLLEKASGNKMGIVLDTDKAEIKRVKVMINAGMADVTDPQAAAKFLNSMDHYFDLDKQAQTLKLFSHNSVGVVIYDSSGAVTATLNSKQQIDEYLGNFKAAEQKDPASGAPAAQ